MPIIIQRLSFGLLLLVSFAAQSSDFGSVGLIDTPTARMSDDGEFTTTLAFDGYSQSYGISYQALPWLEGTFRYTGYEDFFFWDRNYELKAQLLEESTYFPAVAVGIRDIVGTSYVGSEYLVANKKIGNLDLSLGLGWGRLAGDGLVDNPLKVLGDRFATRAHTTGKGGTFTTGNWFAGDRVGLFGGVAYQVDHWPLTVMAEYNPDQYSNEVRSGAKAPDSSVSWGVEWQLTPGLTVSASQQNGNRFGLNLTAKLGTANKPVKYKPQPFVQSAQSQEACQSRLCEFEWFQNVDQQASRLGVVIFESELLENQKILQIAFDRGEHRSVTDALNRFHQSIVRLLPSHILHIDYVVREAGFDVQTVRLPARSLDFSDQPISIGQQGRFLAPKRFENASKSDFNGLSDAEVAITLENKIMLFDPDNPLAYQFYLNAASGVELGSNWALKGSVGLPVYDNFDSNTRVSDSPLPHVRSDSVSYLKGSDLFIGSLYAEKRATANRELHYRLFGGYLEQMYAGAGAEVLYQPHRSRLAFGLSGAYAVQRDFDGMLGLQDYSVLTGHGSLYWASPFYNYDFALHAGRYLAKDLGGTLEVRRTFDNGWMLGMWTTLTDVPFDTFGEGSFDKGIFLRIPLESILGSTAPANNYQTLVRPILRDGGARLEGFSGQMWWDIRAARHDVFLRAD
ncbi:hypothetical protein XMD420_000131 [Marinobacterium sp. xm-d-420]|uniref:YjbH domain-containing protein n=1 Tax=Marinobacterium sp. xm-d-420 TaxID=2497737 RepID=UPI001568ACB9|nr:YjbH domain-containing protein [Marinobacterium sp. xm-d-420]NRP26548.1 hypothetical protein [Marinobacterium sp. xm-d-420]